MRFDNSLIDGRECNGVAGKFLIGLDSDDGEEFPRDSQEIAARAAHFKKFAGGSILTDEIQAGLYETIVFWVSQYITTVQLTGVNPQPRGSRTSTMGQYMGWGVYQLFPTKDGRQIFIAVTGNRHWTGLCDALGFDDWKNDPELNSNHKRGMQKPRIAERITQTVEKLNYDEVAERLYKTLVPYAPVNSPLDLVEERQMNEGKRWLHLNVGADHFKLPKLPISMGTTADFSVRQQPGCLGEHTDSILAEAGYSAQEIEKLKAARVVLRSDKMLNVESSKEQK